MDHENQTDALIGSRVKGRYLVEHEIGRGGMGIVFSAHDEDLERTVAIKVLAASYASDEEAVSRFFREAKTAGSIGHPNITAVFDLGRLDDTRPFMVMPLLSGRSIGDIIKHDAPLSPAAVVRLLRGAASGIDALHARGLVHRDVKPENIIVEEFEEESVVARVLDFGLAALTSGEEKVTRDGIISGTPEYMAPEAAQGRNLDPRGDVYSLGVVAYEMLADRVPFEGESAIDTLIQKRVKAAPPLSQYGDFDEDLEAVFTKVLAVDPAARFETAGAFIRALEETVRGSTDRMAEEGVALEPREAEVGGEAPMRVTQEFVSTPPPPMASVPHISPNASQPPAAAPGPHTIDTLLGDIASVTRDSYGHGSLVGAGEKENASLDVGAPEILAPELEQPRKGKSKWWFALAAVGLVIVGVFWMRAPNNETTPSSEVHGSPTLTSSEEALSKTKRQQVVEEEPTPTPMTRILQEAPHEYAGDAGKRAHADASLGQADTKKVAESQRRVVVARRSTRDEKRARALAEQATASLVQGRFSVAARDYRNATRADRKLAAAWRGLGLANEKLGRVAGAKHAYVRYLRLRPTAADATQIRSRLAALK